MFGQGQVGGYLVQKDRINQLLPMFNLFTPKQREAIIKALELGEDVIIELTKKQRSQEGGALGTLAAIGIPLLISALTG